MKKNACMNRGFVAKSVMLCAATLAAAAFAEVESAEYPDRWVHVRNDLTTDEKLDHFGSVIAKAAENAFNGVMWDAGIGGEGVDFDCWSGDRLKRLEAAKGICSEKGIEIIPMVWSVGRAHSLLKHDPTLAECQPVRGVPYRAADGKAEFNAGNAMPMKNIFGGPVSLSATGKRSRMMSVKVKPFRRYRVTARAEQKGFMSSRGEGVNKVPVRGAISLTVTPAKDGRLRNSRETFVGSTVADGKRSIVLEFVSTDCEEARISVGVNYRAAVGEVTFRDVDVAEVGIRHPIVRDGAPFAVRDAATGATYEPGKDYVVPKSDASVPGPKDGDVAIILPPGSAIKPGTALVVDAFEPTRRRSTQVGACMANPGLYAYFEKSAPVIYELFGHPRKWFLSMDEIRAGGSCGLCKASGKDLAHLLADCLARQRDAIRKVCPEATVYAWCDMYDPFVNAKPSSANRDYALCNGGFACGSLIAPKDIVAVVWGGEETALKSLEYFSSHGVPTLYATFYDVYSPDHFRVRGGVETANRIPGCRGLMYTTWVKGGKYDLLGAFGELMKTKSRPLPAKEPLAFRPGNSEVVVEAKASPVVEFAAAEATNFLSRVLDAPVPIVREPTPGRASLVLGENRWSRDAGIDPSAHPRDTFIIRTHGGKVFVAGVDGKANPRRASVMSYERGTLFGTYAFLEDYAGCRFYFPGELGEVAPRRDEIAMPDTDRTVTPDCLIRKYYNGDGEWFEEERRKGDGKRLNWLRVRASTTSIPCCHGTAYMKFVEKFSKTHPEYFALRKDGSRCFTYTGSKSSRNGYLCFSSGIRDEVVEECVRRFNAGKKYVDIMPNDAMPRCLCEKCQAAYSKTDPKCYATELIWDYTRYVANKLIERGVPGIVTQMAYAQYRRIPDFDIPTNVYVMVAESGPWSLTNKKELSRQYEEIRAWNRKIGHPVWIWTYPHKYGPTNIPGIPDVAPRAWGEYYKGLAGDIIGTFAESETDQWIYHYLNYYVFSRVMWDAKTDIGAVLDEHHRLMFGRAEDPMRRFYELLERKWVNGIVGKIEDTDAGPVTSPPSELEVWSRVYGPDTIAQLDSLLREAAAAVASGSIEAKRIAFIRREYYDRLVAGAQTNAEKRRAIKELRWKAGSAEPILLRPFKVRKGREPEEFVRTAVTIERTAADIVVRYDCEDNRMDDAAVADRAHDDFNIWQDAGLEIVLNPSADMKTYYHILVNLNGTVSDQKGVRLGSRRSQTDASWESGAKVQIEKRIDGWKATVSIPLASLGEVKDAFPAEFARNRVTRSGKGHCLYNWSPYSFGFNSLTEAGTVILK